jgi:hypothetical protein
MDDYYDSDEWGEIVYEESSKNREIRGGPIKTKGATSLFAGIFDIVLVGALFYLATQTDTLAPVPDIIVNILLVILIASGIVAFVMGGYYLSRTPKRLILMENGLVLGKFKHFDTMPMIEIRGPKGQVVVVSRKGAGPIYTDVKTMKGKGSYSMIIEAPYEYDFMEFKDNLMKLGYNGAGEVKVEAGKEEAAGPKGDGGGAPSAPSDGPDDG